MQLGLNCTTYIITLTRIELFYLHNNDCIINDYEFQISIKYFINQLIKLLVVIILLSYLKLQSLRHI